MSFQPIDYSDQRSMARASLLADDGPDTFRAIYADRRARVRRIDDVKRAPMRPAGVRKMRQSRKRRKGTIR